jgi:Ca-activated chloride channel family protein
MLAEDVRPNRFEKASLLAKHFIKKAVGHQISIVVFSDGQKRIVPFTNDMDLIEARLNALKELDLERGGTGLSLAIQESIQYFVDSEKRPFGNILVLTDAEETDGGLDLDVPEGISVGVVGVGTAKGAPIPMRSSRGVFSGNKKHQGKTVISKLDEEYLKKLGTEIEHFKYWVASSYSLPTEKILGFFNRAFKTKNAKDC